MTTGGGEAGKGTWLPNLVGGVSIWKLAPDLNQPHLFDGRLLEPEVEGSESLPTRVVWHVERLLPLAEARAAHGAEVDQAVHELLAAVERVAKEMASPSSGFRKFRDAFSVPSLEGEGAASYFYDPAAKKVRVANWGASPRTIAGHGELVFGYEKLDRFAEGARAALGGAAVGGAAAAGAEALAEMGPPVADVPGADPAKPSPQVTGADAEEAAKKAAEDEAKKKAEAAGKKPIWVWILAVVVGVAAVVALLLLLKECREPEAAVGPDAGADAGVDSGADAGADADADSGADADAGDADAGDADAGDADAGDADAGDADAGDADAGDAGDAGTDAGDAGADAEDGGAGSGSGEVKVGGDGTGLGQIFLVPGGVGPATAGPPVAAQGIPFRSHFQPGATSWRITTGASRLHRSLKPRMNAGSFEVFLEPGASFSEVQVEWKDAGGAWHVH